MLLRFTYSRKRIAQILLAVFLEIGFSACTLPSIFEEKYQPEAGEIVRVFCPESQDGTIDLLTDTSPPSISPSMSPFPTLETVGVLKCGSRVYVADVHKDFRDSKESPVSYLIAPLEEYTPQGNILSFVCLPDGTSLPGGYLHISPDSSVYFELLEE